MSLIGTLLIATPAIIEFIDLPGKEPLSELYLLGLENLSDNFPKNMTIGQVYSFNVGVTNNLGHSACYIVYVKLRNGTDPLPDVAKRTPSSLPILYENRFVLQDDQKYTNPIVFSLSKVSVINSTSTIESIIINNEEINVIKTADWDSTNNLSYYQLFFELWLYNSETNSIDYNNRFVSLSINYTQPAAR